jgi:hypothetical protein
MTDLLQEHLTNSQASRVPPMEGSSLMRLPKTHSAESKTNRLCSLHYVTDPISVSLGRRGC